MGGFDICLGGGELEFFGGGGFGLVPGNKSSFDHAAQDFFLAGFGQLGVGAEGGIGGGRGGQTGEE